MRPMRAGVSVGHFHASRPEAADRRAAPEHLHRLRTLRRGLSDRLGPARRLSRGKSASRGSRRASLARADAGAVPLPALEPRVHIVSRSRAGARDDCRGGPPRADGQQSATGGVYAGHRSGYAEAHHRLYCRDFRFGGPQARESAAEAFVESSCRRGLQVPA